jgi:hypothetical protein
MTSPVASVMCSPSAEAGPLPAMPASVGSPAVAADSGTVAAATKLVHLCVVAGASVC